MFRAAERKQHHVNDVNHYPPPQSQNTRREIATPVSALWARATAMYPRAVVILGVLAVASAAIWPTWPPLVKTWRVMPEYDSGQLLVPFIICWIAVRSCDLPRPTSRISPFAIAALVVCVVLWLVAYKASSNIGEQLLMPPILGCAAWAAFGWPIAMRLAVPLACLYFAIPLWEFLVPILQGMAVRVTETVLGVTGIPVHIDGVLVNIPEGTFKIAEGCAGRRYFVVCLTVAALLAGISRMRPVRAILFLGIAAALAIVMNWIRILTVIYIGHVTNMQSYLVRVEHLSFGWALFAVLMIIVCLVGSRLARSGVLPTVAGEQGPKVAGGRVLLLRPAVPFTFLFLLMPLLAVAYSRSEGHSADTALRETAASLTLPEGSGGWSGPRSPAEGWQPVYRGAAALGRGSYRDAAGDVIEVFTAEYRGEERGAKVVGYANILFPTDWMVLRRGAFGRAAGREGARANLLWLETPAGERWLVSSVYSVDGFRTGSDAVEQIAYGILGWGNHTRSRIVAVASRCRPSCDYAKARLERFWNTTGPRLLGDHR